MRALKLVLSSIAISGIALAAAHAEILAKIDGKSLDTAVLAPNDASVAEAMRMAQADNRALTESQAREQLLQYRARSALEQELPAAVAPECTPKSVEGAQIDAFIQWWSARVNGKVAENNWLASPPPPLADAIAAREKITTLNESARKYARQQIASWMQLSCVHKRFKGTQFRNAVLVPGSKTQTGQFAIVDGMLFVFPSHAANLQADYASMIDRAQKAKKLSFESKSFKSAVVAFYADKSNASLGASEAEAYFAQPYWEHH